MMRYMRSSYNKRSIGAGTNPRLFYKNNQYSTAMENHGGGIISALGGAIGGAGAAVKTGAINLQAIFNHESIITATSETLKVAWFGLVGGIVGWLVKEVLNHLKHKYNGRL